MSFLGDVKEQSELVKKFSSPAAFKKALVDGEVVLSDGSKWQRIPNTPSNAHLWSGRRSKRTTLFYCVGVVEDDKELG